MGLFESMSFENLMKRALASVAADVDKRQGSIIYDAIAPAIAEITQFYIECDHILDMTFADSSVGEWLEARTAEQGVFREPATKAVRLGKFFAKDNVPMDVGIGVRLNIEDVNFIVIEKVTLGQFRLECETAGSVGNKYFGKMTPVDNVNDLALAELSDVLIPGEDTESDDLLFARFVLRITDRAFGGNRADYREKILAMDGVGAVKLERAWAGGGTVKAYLLDSDFNLPSATLLGEVQTAADPLPGQGDGIGFAPMFHVVTIAAADTATIDITLNIQTNAGLTLGQAKTEIVKTIEAYFLALKKSWQASDMTVVRISAIEQAVLNAGIVVDLRDTLLLGDNDNVALPEFSVPVLGEVIVHAL